VSFIFDFEAAVARHARERGVVGVICGHIHAAAIREIDGIVYMNCGDWVDSCTAIVEHFDGRMELVVWSNKTKPSTYEAPPIALPASEPVALLERDDS